MHSFVLRKRAKHEKRTVNLEKNEGESHVINTPTLLNSYIIKNNKMESDDYGENLY